jgi:hypothetical protein
MKARRRHALVRPAAAMAAAALGLTALAPGLSAAESFRFSTTQVMIEGAATEVPSLASSLMTLSAFSFGAWRAGTAATGGPGTILQHKTASSTTLVVVAFGPGEGVDTPLRWRAYLSRQISRLGPQTLAETTGDSTVNSRMRRVLGWTTFEGQLTVADEAGDPTRTEKHVVASNGTLGVAFVLAGPTDAVEQAERDFGLFISRLRLHEVP